jgi:hypothetical protein
LQSGRNKGIPEFNLQWEISWTESTMRWTGSALGSTVDRGRRGHRARRCLAGARHTGARAHRGAGGSEVVGRSRGTVAVVGVPVRGSLGLRERRRTE